MIGARRAIAFAVLALALPAGQMPALALDRNLLAHCQGCNLSDRDLHGQDLHALHLLGTDAHETNLRQSDLHGSKIVGGDFSGAHLDEANVRDSTLVGTELNRATLSGTRFDGTSMIGVNARAATMNNAHLEATTLVGVDFSGSNLRDAAFNGAQTCQVNNVMQMSCINLRGADVTGADFRGVRSCDYRAQSKDDNGNTIVTDAACRAVSAGELRKLTHNQLVGARLP